MEIQTKDVKNLLYSRTLLNCTYRSDYGLHYFQVLFYQPTLFQTLPNSGWVPENTPTTSDDCWDRNVRRPDAFLSLNQNSIKALDGNLNIVLYYLGPSIRIYITGT